MPEKQRLSCYPNFDFKQDKCQLCFDRLDCMLEFYRLKEIEKAKHRKFKREPGEEVDWESINGKRPYCLGTYMDDEQCEECPYILDCKELTDKCTGEKVRSTGKYKGKGKERRRDIA